MSVPDLPAFSEKSKRLSKENQKFLLKLKDKNPRKVDDVFHRLHDEVFEQTDCLACANCCKTTSPIFYQTDIERVAKSLRMKPGDFVKKYLRVDEDNDLVLQSTPCPFLLADNRCKIYTDRPKACREYPHTNRKKMVQIMDLTHRNTLVCPAVLEMVEQFKRLSLEF
ncbi:MAG: YkgJ family cysteine cluster protein [Flammeovirgaceae bacterium]|nr:MAG: YkgJ family cysteine cluster protein [Flammeovirgaceae bacterium]